MVNGFKAREGFQIHNGRGVSELVSYKCISESHTTSSLSFITAANLAILIVTMTCHRSLVVVAISICGNTPILFT